MPDEKLQIVLAAQDLTRRAFRQIEGRIGSINRAVFSLKGGLAALGVGYGFGQMAREVLNVASSFEQMEIKLDQLTQGRGRETLDELNAWAVDMPVNTQKAVDAFVMMQAFGLNPTLETMQRLVDVSAVMGEDALPRVARALGQIQARGKLSSQEINQLSEVGINARKYLTEAFGMTVEELQNSQIAIEDIIDAIWQGMDADFSGAAQRAMNSWQGLRARFESTLVEIARTVAGAGVFDTLKEHFAGLNEQLSIWLENNREMINQNVPIYIEKIESKVKDTWDFFSDNSEILEYGIIGLLLYGKKGAVIGAAVGAAQTRFEAIIEGMKLVNEGYIELDTLLAALHPRAEITLEMLVKGAKEYGQAIPIEEQKRFGITLQDQRKIQNELWDESRLHDYAVALESIDAKFKQIEPLQKIPIETELQFKEIAAIPTPQELYGDTQRQYEELNKFLIESDQLWSDLHREAVKDAMRADEEFIDAWLATQDEITKANSETAEILKDTMDTAAASMSQSLSSLFFDVAKGEFKGFENFAMSIFDSILRQFTDILAGQIVGSLFGEGGFLGGLFPGRQYGGPVRRGQTYVVGEAGPEILHMGSGGGYVSPMTAAGAGESGNVNVIIQNYGGQQVQQRTQRGPGNDRSIFVTIGSDIVGGGPLARAIEQTYDIRRRGRLI